MRVAVTAPEAGAEIEIVPVATKADLDRFIKLPFALHADDPHWIPPLLMERREALSRERNPYFQHAEAQFWIACRDGRDVGRISAQVDRLYLETHKDATGHFGMLAAEDDPAIFRALMATAEDWLKVRGMKRVLGPFNLSINEETGVLVDGFDTPPMMLMGHDRAYVHRRIEELGFGKEKDLYVYLHAIGNDLTPGVRAMLTRKVPANVTVRPLSLKNYDEEIRTLTSIFNEAWSDNWGFVPLTEAETAHMAKTMKPLVDPRLVHFVEVDGVPACFAVCLPNLNEAIADLKGRLLPFGWLKLLWRLKVKGVKTARVPLMGVRRSYAGTWAGAVMPFMAINAMREGALARKMERFELGWILEDNMPMRRINESLRSVPYKTYRVYGKALV